MAAGPITNVQARKEALIAENALLRGDLDDEFRYLAPTVDLLASGYQLSRSAATVWNIMSPLRGNKRWKFPRLLLRLMRARFH
jgi:hypothetical protein